MFGIREKELCKSIGIIIGGKIKKIDDIRSWGCREIFDDVRMAAAPDIAAAEEQKGILAFVTTGGTAPELRKAVQCPVIIANPTFFDLLETLRDFENDFGIAGKHLALMLHVSSEVTAERIRPFINNDLTIFKYQNENQIKSLLELIKPREFFAVIGGPTTLYWANEFGLVAYLLALGRETMLNAVEKAYSVLFFTQHERELNKKLQTVINLFPEGILATDDQGMITMFNPRALSILNMTESQVIGQNIDNLTADPTWSDIYKRGQKQMDIIRDLGDVKVFINRQPIIANNKIIGAIGTFQAVSKIEKMEQKYRNLRTRGLIAKYKFQDVIGASDTIVNIIFTAKAYAKVESTILIQGETGTGKELFAQSIHNESSRRLGPFVAVNCAALPEPLLESELMGYEEGAFTGAKRGGKQGLFEIAHMGTLFLDEINQLPLPLQARVLRVLQEKMVLRLGGERMIPVNVRIIAATNEKLMDKVAVGKFRDDLFYRLNVLELQLPPLRSRKEDIPLLLNWYLEMYSGKDEVPKRFSPEALLLLVNYRWPGNVRELGNLVERFAVLSSQFLIIDLQFIKSYLGITDPENKEDKKSEQQCENEYFRIRVGDMAMMEKQLVEYAILRCSGNRIRAAEMLGVSRTTVWKKLKE
ncbi:MAG: sigma 54-interacting transcriptional regulator [Negativicutes bacterium]